MFKCIPLESPDEWKSVLKNIPHSYYHTRENCYAMQLTTGYKTYLLYFEKGNIKIVCPVAERNYEGSIDIVTPYGFSGFTGFTGTVEFHEFNIYWKEFVTSKEYVCGYFCLNPAFSKVSYYNKEDAFKSTNLYFLNLRLSLTELFENLDSNRRKQIVNFKKEESGFIYDREILKDFFVNNYEDFLRRINASSANYFSKATLENICYQDNVYIVGAGSKEKVEAVYIFGFTEFEGVCLFNVATPEGRKHSPLLLWSGLKFFRSKKIPLMNLGGGINEEDNVALSKERFGAYKLPLINLKQIYNAELYKKLCNEREVNSESNTGYFPAYRK